MAQMFARTGTITADTEWLLDPLDFDQVAGLVFEVTAAQPTGTGSHFLDIYLCSRSQSGVWEDRIHVTQLVGDQSGSKYFKYTILSTAALSDSEEAGVMPGPSTGARLAANAVRSGLFPGPYYGNIVINAMAGNMPETGWKVLFDITTGGSFPVTCRIDVMEADPG